MLRLPRSIIQQSMVLNPVLLTQTIFRGIKTLSYASTYVQRRHVRLDQVKVDSEHCKADEQNENAKLTWISIIRIKRCVLPSCEITHTQPKWNEISQRVAFIATQTAPG